jgi:GT2 family glycosyltransferase
VTESRGPLPPLPIAGAITIVIVNWNGGQLLMRCLESIRARAGGVAVVVVDNNSEDGSREAATFAFPEFTIINSGGNLGFGRANNLARQYVDTPLVLFLNPDTELLDDALQDALHSMREHEDAGAVGCRMIDANGKVQELGLQWSMTPWTALLELAFVTERSRHSFRRWLPLVDPFRSAYVRKLYGGFLLVRRDVLDAAGWFDERYFMYAEDADLSRTIQALGWKLYYCAEAVVIHIAGGVTDAAPSTFSHLMKQESINKLIEKYQGMPAALLHRVVVCAGGLVRLAAVSVVRLSSAFRTQASQAELKTSLVKQQQLVLWSLGIRKAAVPQWRPVGRHS